MKNPKYVYHGSGKVLNGKMLKPCQSIDSLGCSDNNLRAVYAYDLKKAAIALGVLSCEGVKKSGLSIRGNMINAIVYEGWPKQSHFYLYTLPSETFENRPRNSYQWISFKPVKPEKIERFSVQDYTHLIKKVN